jgi:hypothetical protein
MKDETKRIVDFVTESVKWLEEKQEGCCEFRFDNNLSLFVGWQEGYDEEDSDYIHAKDDKGWCIVAGIKSNHEYLKTDFDWLTAPYDEKSGEVWDTEITIDSQTKTIDDETAEYFIKEYLEMKEALKNREVKI